MVKKRTLMAVSGALVLASLAAARPAAAQEELNWGGGPMKNLIIDVIFWGKYCPLGGVSCAPRQDVLDYIADMAAYLRGVPAPTNKYAIQGYDAPIHYYGVTEIALGNFVVGPTDLGAFGPPNTSNPGLDEMQAMVNAARNGTYGAAYDFSGNYAASALPSGGNRLPIVVSFGANAFDDYAIANGFHDASIGLYAAAQWEDRPNLMHEILEAMTDPNIVSPVILSPNGWSGDLQVNYWPPSGNYPEVADQCETNEYAPQDPSQVFFWTGSQYPNNNISGLARLTVNAPYKSDNQPALGCETSIPEQHAPMTAIVEGSTVVLDYLRPDGAIGSVQWNTASLVASGITNLGRPAANVTAVGKPSLVYNAAAGGEYLFTKGSDGGLWMHHGPTWTNLGGQIFGDPSAVIWANGTLLDVFVLGIDDTLYYYGMNPTTSPMTMWGYSSMPNNNGTRFVTGPKVLSRNASSLDVFAVGEDGSMKWMGLTTAGWGPVTTVSDDARPYIGTPAAFVSKGLIGGFELFGTGEQNGYFHGSWNPASGWGSWEGSYFGYFPPYPATLQGTPAVVSWGPGRFDVFGVDRQTQLWHWYKANGAWVAGDGQGGTLSRPPLISGGVIGDPAVVSRGPNQLELFYRTTSANVGHMILNGTTWSAAEIVPINVW